jgi:hypothetical protein
LSQKNISKHTTVFSAKKHGMQKKAATEFLFTEDSATVNVLLPSKVCRGRIGIGVSGVVEAFTTEMS